MDDEQEGPNNQELMKLLPFYANRTLCKDEQQSVEDYLAHSEEARQELVFLCRLREAVKRLPSANSPGELGLKRLQSDMNRKKVDETLLCARAGERASELAGKAQLSARGHGVTVWWRHVAVAACLTLAVFAGLSVETRQGGGDEPQLAGSGNGPVLQVTFKPHATEAAIRALLLEAGLSIKEGPSSLGIYYLDLETGTNGTTLNVALQKLRTRRDIVDTAEMD